MYKKQIINILNDNEDKEKSIYWGISPSSIPDLNTVIAVSILSELSKEGFSVTILIANIHSWLEARNTTLEDFNKIGKLYEEKISSLFEKFGVDKNKYNILWGTDIQTKSEYILSLFELCTDISIANAQLASRNLLCLSRNPRLSQLLYPLMQILDEKTLDTGVQLGDEHQKEIFGLCQKYNNKTYYVHGTIAPLFSYHDRNSKQNKITLYDTNKIIAKKIYISTCRDNIVDLKSNCSLSLLKYLIFPFYGKITMNDKVYKDFDEVERDWLNYKLYTSHIKPVVIDYTIKFIRSLD